MKLLQSHALTILRSGTEAFPMAGRTAFVIAECLLSYNLFIYLMFMPLIFITLECFTHTKMILK